MLVRLICCVVLSVLVCGCRGNISSESKNCAPRTVVEIREYDKAVVTDSALKGRLSAALAIDVVSMREEAVAAVAIDAAKAGNAKAVIEILGHIEAVKRLNDLRSSCAFHLAMAGKSQEAVEIAKMIDIVALRNETFKRIATLEWESRRVCKGTPKAGPPNPPNNVADKQRGG